ncbi:MAG: DUF5717 family protein [Clostridiales bacterium]|nr:DUF5717 family protein [Clostridiales bacterium]
MKRRIEQLLNGIFEYEEGRVVIRPEELELVGTPGAVLRGKFFIEGAAGQRIHGFLYPSDVRMICDPAEFHGISNEIHYQFDCSGLKAGGSSGDARKPTDAVSSGKIVLCCDCGEYEIPYRVRMEETGQASQEMPFSDLAGFVSLAQEHYQKAYRCFLSPGFRSFLEAWPGLLALYEGLCLPEVSYRSMEEFLVGAGLKEAVEVSADVQELDYGELKEPVQETIQLRKNAWGVQTISVESDALFVRPEKTLFSTDEFAGSTFDLNLVLDTNLMHAGNNYAWLTLTTGSQRIRIAVTAKKKPKWTKDRQAHIRKIMMKNLEELYVSFRLQKIDLPTWTERSISVLNSYKRAGGDDLYADLFLIQMYFSDDRKHRAEKLLEQVEAQKENLYTPDRYCYYLYISTFFYREASYVDQVEEEVGRQFYRNPACWQLLWILLYLQEKYLCDPDARYEAVAEQFQRGCRSRILYVEAWHVLRENPFLMRHLDEFELHLLRFADQEKVMTAEVLRQTANLAMHRTTYDHRLFEVLTNGWLLYPSDDLIKAICQLLIRGGKMERQYFTWYSLGVEHGLRMNGLYEAYLRTMDLPSFSDSDESMRKENRPSEADFRENLRQKGADHDEGSAPMRYGANNAADGDVRYGTDGTADGEAGRYDKDDYAAAHGAGRSVDGGMAWSDGGGSAGEDVRGNVCFADLPQIIRMYFVYDTSLDYHRRAALYRSIVQNRDNDPQAWVNHRAAMERFVMEQLESAHVTDDLAVLYQKFLREGMLTAQLARRLIQILFTYEITCDLPGIRQIVVHSCRIPQERSVNLRNGRGYIRIYDPDSAVLAVDEKGQRTEVGRICRIRHVFEDEKLLAWCAKKVPDHPGMVAFLCVENQKASLMNDRLLPYFRSGCEQQRFSPAFRDALRKQVLLYYMEHLRDDTLPEFLEQISYEIYACVDKPAMITLLAEEGKCTEAFTLLNTYGAEDIPLIQLVRICSRMVLEVEFEENAMLLSLCHWCFAKGKYDDKLLRYLLLYYEGSVEDMRQAWDAANNFGLDTMLIEEKILTMMLFTRQGTQGTEPIFDAYVHKLGRKKLCKAYVNLKAYEYFVKGLPVADPVFDYIEKEYRRLGGTERLAEQEEICRLALLQYYARAISLTKPQRVYAAELLEEFNTKGMRFAFYRRFDEELRKPLQLQGHVFAEYVGNPKSTVQIEYQYKGQDTVWAEPVPNCFEGIFVREFTLFDGEELECRFVEELPSDSVPGTEKKKKYTDKWTLKADQEERETGRYGVLNRLCAAARAGDDAQFAETLDSWLTLEYLAEEIFTLI